MVYNIVEIHSLRYYTLSSVLMRRFIWMAFENGSEKECERKKLPSIFIEICLMFTRTQHQAQYDFYQLN